MPDLPETATLDDQAFLDHAASRCKARGASLTPIRRKVLALLRLQPGGLKAYDLLDRIRHDHPSASPPTVYRALDFLIEQGLVHKIGRVNQFVACNQDRHDEASLFLVCPECGQVTELHDEVALVALSRSLKAVGHALAGPEIEISATCRACTVAARRDAAQDARRAS
ncbi:MAG TPA: transcriptional repressor [Rhodocyclaceae bacterium]|nr:transcriptional repressor [Rhodocyclaceae bacterium]